MAMQKEEIWLREIYVDLLIEAAKQDERIVLCEADLMKAAGSGRFKDEFPDRVFNVGVAEASMIGTAAGLSVMGYLPFTHTFTPFSTRRVCDQITLSVSYAGLNVKIMGSDPGVTAELNGGTHMSMEDVAIMRNIPNMVIYEPVDSAQLRNMFSQLVAHDGPVYIRLLRRAAVKVFDEGESFTLGKGKLIREGSDVSIFASGIEVAEALEAADRLLETGIHAEVINIHTIKPLDTQAVVDSVQKTGCAVTAENHSILNGLGGAVAETLCEQLPAPQERVGIADHFGEVGFTDYLMEKYHLKAADIVLAAQKAIARKTRGTGGNL